MRFLATLIIGSALAVTTTLLVLLYWALGLIFRVLQALTFPLHVAWRTVRPL